MQAECTALTVNQTVCVCVCTLHTKNKCMPHIHKTHMHQASVTGLVVRIDEVLGDLTSIRTLILN